MRENYAISTALKFLILTHSNHLSQVFVQKTKMRNLFRLKSFDTGKLWRLTEYRVLRPFISGMDDLSRFISEGNVLMLSRIIDNNPEWLNVRGTVRLNLNEYNSSY